MVASGGRKVAIVTGASGGIGRWIALGLARADRHVVLVCRDAVRAGQVAAWIGERVASASTETVLADLSSLADVRAAGQAIAADHPGIEILVNNAGMFTSRRQVTAEGHEAVLAVNHLAPFVLASVLEGALREGAPSRIVNVGSSTSDRARIDPDDLELERGWGMVRAYGRSKLAMLMATMAAAGRLAGTGVTANVVHPGAVASGLIREPGAIGLAWRAMAPFLRTEEQGADTPLHVALSPEWVRTGTYVKDRKAVAPNRRALDGALVARVVAATEVIAGHPPRAL